MNRKKALEILPAIVDNEASSDEQVAFFDFIEHDETVRKEYEEALKIKQLLKTKYKRVQTPEHLANRINKIIAALEEQTTDEETKIYNLPSETSTKTHSDHSTKRSVSFGSLFRYLAAAAVILFFTLVTIQLLDRTASYEDSLAGLVVENIAAEHFIKSSGQLIEPHFGTHSVTDAEQYLLNHFGMVITVPNITGAQFEGIVMADFIEGFQTPLLEYTQPEINETIYLFAFDMDKVLESNALKRHHEAVAACNTDHDFFVAEIDEHHVVSWLWNNTWYSAISNHNGYDLAGLVEPLQYNR